jgi:hypothetical protein
MSEAQDYFSKLCSSTLIQEIKITQHMSQMTVSRLHRIERRMTSINLAVHCDILLTDELYAVKSSQMIFHVCVKEFSFLFFQTVSLLTSVLMMDTERIFETS